MTAFRKLGEEAVWRSPLLTVAVGRFAAPDGSTFERDVVHHPGAVSVVPVDDDGTVVLVRQFRAAVERDLLEIPAGKCDVAGEDRALTARRELQEEVGLRAGRLESLGGFYNSPGFCDEYCEVFLARDLEACADALDGIEEQHLSVERVQMHDAPGLVARGEIVDAKTIIGLFLAREALSRERK